MLLPAALPTINTLFLFNKYIYTSRINIYTSRIIINIYKYIYCTVEIVVEGANFVGSYTAPLIPHDAEK